ncbi:hypothetical protein [Longivirga aurantiaca]|uniref:Uncharacterized protein n=1 Tax=Longivirga aurantiaca TaxID=1837743 RepID=A0ABW1SWG1_9ACTN
MLTDLSVGVSQRRAMQRSVHFVEARMVVTFPSRSAAQRWIRTIFDSDWSSWRRSSGAFTLTCLRLIIAAVLAFTAMSLATLIYRIISTTPSWDFEVVRPPGTEAAAGTWPDAVVDVVTVSTEWLEPSPRRDGPPGTSSEARRVESTYDAVLAIETATSPAGREPVPYVAKALRGNCGMLATLELMGAVLEA